MIQRERDERGREREKGMEEREIEREREGWRERETQPKCSGNTVELL